MTVEPHDKFVNQYRSGILQDEQAAAARTIVNLLGESLYYELSVKETLWTNLTHVVHISLLDLRVSQHALCVQVLANICYV